MLLTIIRKELLLTVKDIHALLVLFLMPTAFILIMSLSLQDTFEKSDSEKPYVGILFLDETEKTKPLAISLTKINGFQVNIYQNKSKLLSDAKRDVVQAAIIIPKNFFAEIESEALTPESKRLQLYFAPTTPQVMGVLIESSVRKSLASDRLIKALNSFDISPRKQKIQIDKFNGYGLMTRHELYSVQTAKKPSSVQQSVPAWLIFSMFFVVIPITTTFLNEKQHGTLQRLQTLPIPTSYFLIGKLVPYLGINLIQTCLMFLVGIFLVPVLGGQALEFSNQSWLLLPMSLAVSIAAITLALLIATVVNTVEQATTIGGLINLILAALGGIMVPTFVMPAMMQDVAKFSPMNWGLEGYLVILLRGGDFSDILPEIMKLSLLSIVMFGIAIVSYRRSSGK